MEKRIETTISRTAEMTFLMRAASNFEKLPQYRSNDNIAQILIPIIFKPLLKIGFIRKLLTNIFTLKWIYEYVIARTKYIHEAFEKAIGKAIDQILIFGFGFDTRAIRFQRSGIRTIIFWDRCPSYIKRQN